MDAAIMAKRAAEMIGHLEGISDPEKDDDATKQAILTIACETYKAKIARDMLVASLHQVLSGLKR